MRTVTVQEAKTQLSALLRAVEDGEEIEIRRGSKPVARLVKSKPKYSIAAMRGMFEGQVEAPDPSVWDPDPQDAIDFGLADPPESES